jgi:hypothetical protein
MLPPLLTKLVSQEPPIAPEFRIPAILKWYEYDDHFTVVLEDGRKITYKKADPEKPRHELTPADIKEHTGPDKKRPELNKHKEK